MILEITSNDIVRITISSEKEKEFLEGLFSLGKDIYKEQKKQNFIIPEIEKEVEYILETDFKINEETFIIKYEPFIMLLNNLVFIIKSMGEEMSKEKGFDKENNKTSIMLLKRMIEKVKELKK